MRKKLKEPPIMDAIGDRVKDRPPRAKNAHLDDDDRLVIIWGLSRGWTAGKIARTLPASVGTVKNFKAKILDEPACVFELPVLVQSGPRSHDCQICGGSRASRIKGMRHVLGHILPLEVARDMPLGDIEKPL